MFQPILFLLALIDVFAGVLIISHSFFSLNLIFLYFAYIVGIKGLWSMITSAGMKFYFDFMGFVDVVAGLCLALINFHVGFNFFWIIGLIMILKGLWAMIFCF
jgi:hypothetical protein